jgi:rod shape-determining protein MreC
LGLRKENEYLKNENVQLRQQLNQKHPQRYQSHDTVFRDTSLPQTQQPTYTYMPAEVVRNTTNKRDNYFYINQGTKHGIETGMAVLSPNGVAGVVVTTSTNFSRVMSILHSDFELTPFIPALNLRQGVVKWEGTDARFGYLKEVNRTEDVKKGQWILSSNYSSIFPPNIPVGRVIATSKPLQQQYRQIKIVFATDFHRLHYVYCVKNHAKAEIDALNTNPQP